MLALAASAPAESGKADRVAVTNEEIEEIWAAVDVGTVVEIRP